MKSLKKVLIFGATSAIAEQVARKLVARGASLYCVGRDQSKLSSIVSDLKVRSGFEQRIFSNCADLNDMTLHPDIFKLAEDEMGGIDAILIAHGSLPKQHNCEVNVPEIMKEIQTNALSVISLASIAANYFEQEKNGVIAVISSVAGDRGRQSNYVYGAAKGMLTLFLQGLRNRLYKSNVSVVTIKPGFVDTPMTAGFEKKGFLWATPENVADGIVNAMLKGKDEVYLPSFWWGIMLVIKNIPEFIFKRMSL